MRVDPEASGCDAFTVNWENYSFYYAPPPLFTMILRTLRKVQADRATGVIIVPDWPTKPWFPLLTSLLVADRFFLPKRASTLKEDHHMAGTMKVMAYLVLGAAT